MSTKTLPSPSAALTGALDDGRTRINSTLHYRCGHVVPQVFTCAETMRDDRANARFAICRACHLVNSGASEWMEEEIFFDRQRINRRMGHPLLVIQDRKWAPQECDNPTMFYLVAR